MEYVVGQHDQRPWGSWEVIAVGSGYAVKRIVVGAGQRLSLQRHAFRAEHWVLVAGAGRVTRGAEVLEVAFGDHVMIARGDVHRIENPGPGDLVLIEVQHGERLDENDIERLDDDYGRR
jgi:mannose-6-phosphate isomerase-like protein (cupin superfamily)